MTVTDAIWRAAQMRPEISVFVVAGVDFDSVEMENGRILGIPVVPSRSERARGTYAFRQDWDGLPIIEQVSP